MFSVRKLARWGAGATGLAMMLWFFATCSPTSSTVGGCSVPAPGSSEADQLDKAQTEAGFPLLYPCHLPGAESFSSVSVTGEPGRRRVEHVFSGPFDLSLRQAQIPPAVNPDPSGASRTTVDLFPNVQATFIQVNDGSASAMYHLFWVRNGVYFELQAYGPPLQQRQILLIATSLQ